MKVSIIMVVMGALVVCPMVLGFGKRCKTAADCEVDECCLNYVLVSFLGGSCQMFRQEGESCTPLLQDSKKIPDMYNFQCPCTAGLECAATHQIKIGAQAIKHRPECVNPKNGTNPEAE